LGMVDSARRGAARPPDAAQPRGAGGARLRHAADVLPRIGLVHAELAVLRAACAAVSGARAQGCRPCKQRAVCAGPERPSPLCAP